MATAASPDPYAPSTAPDVAEAPRPPGRLGVFLWALGASMGTAASLWQPFAEDLPRYRRATLGLALVVPGLVGLVWAYVADRWPLMGSRREGHLVLGSIIMVAAWGVALFVPAAFGPYLGVDIAVRLGAAIGTAATYGALVELARRHAAPGRIAAATVAVRCAVGVASGLLAAALSRASLYWTAGVGIALALSIAIACIASMDSARAVPADQQIGPGPEPSFLRSRRFWGVLAFLSCAYLFGEPNHNSFLMKLVRRTAEAPLEATWNEGALVSLAAIGVTVGFAVLCRRMSAGTLLRLALLARALAFLTLLPDAPVGPGVLHMVRSLAEISSLLPLTTLVIRAAPRGREAIGYALLMGVPGVVGPILTAPLVALLRPSLPMGVAAAAGAAVLTCLGVSLLPKELTARASDHREPIANQPAAVRAPGEAVTSEVRDT
jgi:hypothetical protein